MQHKIEEYGDKMWELLRDNKGYIYVAGNSKNMPQSVREAFVAIFAKNTGFNVDEAEKCVALLERNGRYQTETWA